MYCPSCGIKNEPGQLRCFICEKTMPNGDFERSTTPASGTPRPTRSATTSNILTNTETLGGVGDRMLALILDRLLLLSLLLIPAAAIGHSWNSVSRSLPEKTWLIAGSVAAGIVIVFLYHFVLETLLGTTPGKAILGLYVRNNSRRSRVAMTAIRNGLRIVDALAIYSIGFLIALFSARKQRLGDHIASAVVMERRITWPARAALIVMWASLIAASVWFASLTCPACADSAFFSKPSLTTTASR